MLSAVVGTGLVDLVDRLLSGEGGRRGEGQRGGRVGVDRGRKRVPFPRISVLPRLSGPRTGGKILRPVVADDYGRSCAYRRVRGYGFAGQDQERWVLHEALRGVAFRRVGILYEEFLPLRYVLFFARSRPPNDDRALVLQKQIRHASCKKRSCNLFPQRTIHNREDRALSLREQITGPCRCTRCVTRVWTLVPIAPVAAGVCMCHD